MRLMDLVGRVVRYIMPDSLYDPPPSDSEAEQESHQARRESEQAIRRADRTVQDWRAALEWERKFWEQHR